MKQQAFNFSPFQVAEIELTYQSKMDALKRPIISSSSSAYDLLCTIWTSSDLNRGHQFNIVLLNRANRVLGVLELPVAAFSTVKNYIKRIYTECVKANAVAIILGHYYEGNLEPSGIDEVTISTELKKAGSLLDISFLDCIISSGKNYRSLADQGLL